MKVIAFEYILSKWRMRIFAKKQADKAVAIQFRANFILRLNYKSIFARKKISKLVEKILPWNTRFDMFRIHTHSVREKDWKAFSCVGGQGEREGNECWRSCYPDTMRSNKTVQRQERRNSTRRGAARRNADALHHTRITFSSRDFLRCCLMRFGIRRNLGISRCPPKFPKCEDPLLTLGLDNPLAPG